MKETFILRKHGNECKGINKRNWMQSALFACEKVQRYKTEGITKHTAARAHFSTIEQPVTLTFDISNAATAPPHAKHGSLDKSPAGHPTTLPIAALRVKLQV